MKANQFLEKYIWQNFFSSDLRPITEPDPEPGAGSVTPQTGSRDPYKNETDLQHRFFANISDWINWKVKILPSRGSYISIRVFISFQEKKKYFLWIKRLDILCNNNWYMQIIPQLFIYFNVLNDCRSGYHNGEIFVYLLFRSENNMTDTLSTCKRTFLSFSCSWTSATSSFNSSTT